MKDITGHLLKFYSRSEEQIACNNNVCSFIIAFTDVLMQ